MGTPPLSPLADVPIPAQIAALPKADIHIHAEAAARLEQIIAAQRGQPPADHRPWVAELLTTVPPGMPRLQSLDSNRRFDRATVDALDTEPAYIIARIMHLLEEGAAQGALLIEITFGPATIEKHDFMALFREAERRVQTRFPKLRAEAIIAVTQPSGERWRDVQLPACLAAAREGLAGINIIPHPYDAEMDWAPVVGWAARASDAGLGLTAHAGEFDTTNIAAALQLPGLTRIGHAVYAAHDPWLLEQLAQSGVTVECSLSCNVVLGAVTSYETHPIRQFVESGIPVALSTDDPVRVATTIGREYAIAAALGFTEDALRDFTRNAVRASFAPAARRSALLAEIDAPMAMAGAQ
jgi:adenosine deaminase